MTHEMTSKMPAGRKRAFHLAGALLGLAVALGGCKHTEDNVTTAGVPGRNEPARNYRGTYGFITD